MPPVDDEALDAAIRRELAPGETVVWKGRPIALRLARAYWLATPVGISISIGLGMQMARSIAMLKEDGIDMAVLGLFGVAIQLLFFVIGVGCILAPFHFYFKAMRTVYAITTDRVVAGAFGRSVDVKSVAISDVVTVSRQEAADGVGTIRMELKSHRISDGAPSPLTFEMRAVPDVRSAEEALRRVMASRRVG